MKLVPKVVICGMMFYMLILLSCSYLPENVHVDSRLTYNETPDYIALELKENEADITLMFLPGGLVDPHAYLSLMQRIALDSINIVIPKFTSNLAIFELSKYESLLDVFPDAGSLYIAGHSLGGIAALSAVSKSPDEFDGLILLGTYPSESFAISDWDRSVLSLYAENDSLSTPQEVLGASSFLPEACMISDVSEIDSVELLSPKTFYYQISGGNHAQFGDYGAQEGDGVATISVEEQHEQVSSAIIKFVRHNENY
ncbi:MAG: alpha/beta hydrolase [Candidatus Neomarinimicrobiota bacterium]